MFHIRFGGDEGGCVFLPLVSPVFTSFNEVVHNPLMEHISIKTLLTHWALAIITARYLCTIFTLGFKLVFFPLMVKPKTTIS